MKLNNRGWGYKMMAFLMSILAAFFLVALYYIYRFYNRMPRNMMIVNSTIMGEK